jgi:hypothetical protein
VRGLVVCGVLALAACGGGGSNYGAPDGRLYVNWVSTQGAAHGSGTQADPIHLASPPLAVDVTVTRNGLALAFWLDAGACSAVSLSPGPPPVGTASGGARTPNDSVPAALYAWEITSASKGTCTIAVRTADGSTATLQVYSEL